MENFKNLFASMNDPKRIKTQYYKYAMKYHPDHGGDAEIFKALNEAYLERLEELDGSYYSGDEKDEVKFTFDKDAERIIVEKIDEFFKKAPEHISLSLVGTWLWADNTVKEDRDLMKELGFRWSGNKKMWYYTAKYIPIRYHKKYEFYEIADRYGCDKLFRKRHEKDETKVMIN